MHIYNVFYIKTFKIAPTCFDPKSQVAQYTTHMARRTLSGVRLTQYDMLPQH